MELGNFVAIGLVTYALILLFLKNGMSATSGGLLAGLVASILVHVGLVALFGAQPSFLISVVMFTPLAVISGFFFARAIAKEKEAKTSQES